MTNGWPRATNRQTLISAIAHRAEIEEETAERVLDSIQDSIVDALKRGEPVSLVGFGTFLTRDRAARPGRNPQTGATIQIAASRVPAFKAGKALKDALN